MTTQKETWSADDEVTITYGTLVQAQKESFEMGEESMKRRVCDWLQSHVCGSCEEHLSQFGLDPVLYTTFPHASCEGLLGAIDLLKEGGMK